ncbi:MAG: protein kinase [bacterium]|nr:protein kinase [bacterium]
MDETEVANRLLPPPPERVGPYRIETRLGVGGMGAVYRAQDERLKRPVAIKQILPEMAGDEKAWKRLRREAQAVARLNHPAIVQIYDIVERDTGDWIVMELVEGDTLYSMVESGPLELSRALDLLRQVTEGLVAAHDKGIVHRDLKAENVMVTADGRAKILDFGLAKLLWHQGDKSLSIEGSILGTGRAMSPEQALGDDVDHRSDLFSLGTLMYETVSGKAPFHGSSIFRTLAQVCSDPHTPVREINGEVPMALAALIDRMLEKDPARRPQTAGEVLEALDAIEVSPGARGPAVESGVAGAKAAVAEPVEAEATLWMHPAQRGRIGSGGESSSGLHIRTLLRIHLEDPARKAELGTTRARVVGSRHDRLVRDLLAKSGGLEIDRRADGFLLLFERPAEAVAYALTYQRALAEFGEEEGVELSAGAGIHLGEMFMSENLPADVSRGAKLLEVQGPAKLIAQRTAELARRGQILMTQMAFELARRAMAAAEETEDLDWVARGRYQFGGVEEIQIVFEVGPAGVASTPPPADTETATRLLGRRADEAGPGSRLRRWLPAAVAAVALLTLAIWPPSCGPQSGARETLAVLGFKNLSGSAETEWLSIALAELLAAELATAGDLRLVPGESVARMKLELSVPTSETLAGDTLQAIRRNLGSDYVLVGSYLMLTGDQRALRLNLRLQSTEGDETIAHSATGSESRLFELVSEAALGLREKLGLGQISSEDAAAVRATVSGVSEANRLYSEGLAELYSYHALTARDLLLDAVATDPEYALAHAALSQAWSDLGYDKNARESGRRAFELAKDLPGASYLAIEGRLHEVMGEWDKAEDTYGVLREYHPDDVDHGLRLVRAQTRAGRGREALVTIESLRGLPAPARDDPRIDLAEAAARDSLSDYQGTIDAAERAVAKGRGNGTLIVIAEALQRQWRSLRNLGRAQEAEAALAEARRLFAVVGDRGRVAQALSGAAVLLEDRGQLSEAEKLFRQALEIHREIGHRKGVAEGLNSLADLILDRGELESAREMVGQAVAAARELGDREAEAKYLDTSVWILLRLSELAEAEQLARQGLAIYEEIGNREGVAWGHYYLAQVAFAQGQIGTARGEYVKVIEIGREIGSNHLPSFALHGLAEVDLAQGDLAAAMRNAEESQSVASELTPVEIELQRCRLLLESGEAAEVVEAALRLAPDLRAEERRDDEAAVMALLAQAQLARGDLAAARAAVDRSRTLAAASQNPALRLSVDIAVGRFQAAGGDVNGAVRLFEAARREAQRRSLVGLVWEARLASAEVEAASGKAGGRARLEALEAEAGERGFGLVARKAAAALGRSGG